jgi:uncharacterized protein YqhQ
MTEEVKTITFNDKEYTIDSISDKAKYFINQIQDLNTQGVQTRARLDQIEVAAKAFTDMLKIELETEVDDGND